MLVNDTETQERHKRIEFLAWALEKPERFVTLCEIIPKGRGGKRQKLILQPIQRQYIAQRTQRDVVLKPRQIGFTTLTQALDLYHLLTNPGARVVVTCQSIVGNAPTNDISERYRIMFDGLRRAGFDIKFRADSKTHWALADRDSTLRIIEAGASEQAANKKGRAGTISRLHLTETAFYEYADETLNAMLECVPGIEHGSEIVSESTPNGASGFFYEQCTAARAGSGAYRFHFYPWFDQPEYKVKLAEGEVIKPENDRESRWMAHGVTPEQIKWYRAKIVDKGYDKTSQEYPADPVTCFLESGRGFFEKELLNNQLEALPELSESERSQRVRIFAEPEPNAKYVIGADTSEGVGKDRSGAVIREYKTHKHMATITGQYTTWDFARELNRYGRKYNNAELGVERNNHGHSVIQALLNEYSYPNLYRAPDLRYGWVTSPASRTPMLDELQDIHRNGTWSTPDRLVLEEFKSFIVNDAGRAEAKRGAHDDLVIAEAICWAVRQTIPVPTKSRALIRTGPDHEQAGI